MPSELSTQALLQTAVPLKIHTKPIKPPVGHEAVPQYQAWLATDLDGTYLVQTNPASAALNGKQPSDPQVVHIKDRSLQKRLNQWITQLNRQGILGVIHTTGRSTASYQTLLNRIPRPDFYITGDGRFIYHGRGRRADQPLQAWEDQHQHYSETTATQIFNRLSEPTEPGSRTPTIPFLTFEAAYPDRVGKPELYPAKGQVSRYVAIDQLPSGQVPTEVMQQVKSQLEAAIKAEKLDASVLANFDESRTRLIFRIKPRLATKEGALTFLKNLLNIPSSRLIVAGDNYNDQAMFGCGDRVILAGRDSRLQGFRDAVTQASRDRFGQAGQEQHLYVVADYPQENSLFNGVRTMLKHVGLVKS